MVRLGETAFRLLHLFRRATTLPALIALAVIIAAGVLAESQNRALHEQNMRGKVMAEIGLIRSALEGQLHGNIQLVRGLVSVIATEPNMNQERFASLAANLFDGRTQLRNVAAAPDFVISMIYPRAGNEAAIGLDYQTLDAQREAAVRARDTGELVLAGPVDLVQGGRGFIARLPVFVPDGSEEPLFWGIVSAVIDVEELYRGSGLPAASETLDIAIYGKDALGAQGELFHGDAAILAAVPAIVEVSLPSGSWKIAAAPRRGWAQSPSDVWLFRLLVAVAAVVVIIPIHVACRLSDERREHLREIGLREGQLRELSQRLELALRTSEIGVWEMHLETRRLVWDERMHELYGVPLRVAAEYDVWRSRLHPDDADKAEQGFAECLATSGRYHAQFRVLREDGGSRHIRAIGAVYENGEGGRKIVGVNWDVSRDVALNEALTRAKDLAEARARMLEAAKARIEHNALHDSLTSLPNRRYLDKVLEHVPVLGGDGSSLALLHVDLDRFKQINDTLGHAAGDAMLVHAAGILNDSAGEDRFVARVGGDEFVVLCVDARLEEVAALAEEIVSRMRKPVPYHGHECRFGVSIGVALEQAPDIDPKRLLINADIALYRAKSRGRNRFEFFTRVLQAEIVRNKRLADEILRGLEQDAFEAHFQPQFDAHTLEISGVEALARWRHPSRGILTPQHFIRTAEELNVVSTIDRIMLDQTLAAFRRWREQGFQIPRISVNVSGRRLHDEDLVKSLENLVFNPGMLSFELVESIFLDESDAVVASNIERIKALGIDVELDDFGTGYASIVSLMKVQPKRLKIDRQLVEPIVECETQRDLVRSIIEIGKSLGIGAVAEGVETMRHAAILRDLGCDHLQGYAFGRPMAEEELSEYLRVQQWRIDALSDLGAAGASSGWWRGAASARAAKPA